MTGNPPPLEDLRRLAAAQGLEASDEDLEGVLGFLRAVLPALDELDRSLPPDLPPFAAA